MEGGSEGRSNEAEGRWVRRRGKSRGRIVREGVGGKKEWKIEKRKTYRQVRQELYLHQITKTPGWNME